MKHMGGHMRAHRMGAPRLLRSVAVIGFAVMLAGCSGEPASAPPATTSERPQPSVTATAAPVASAPSARLTAGCDELISPETIAAVFTTETTLRPLGYDQSSDGPVALAVQQLGAVNCVWANGPRRPPWQEGVTEGFSSARLTVVPDGQAPWQEYAATYALAQEAPSPYGEGAFGPRCVPEIGSCFFQALVGTYWADLTVSGVGSAGMGADEMDELVTPLTDGLMQTLAAESAPPAVWVAPEGTEPLPVECTEFLSEAQAEQLSGAGPLRVGVSWDGPRVGQQYYSMSESGAQRCHIHRADSDSGIGHLDYLPGGGWGFDALSAGWLADGSVTSDSVAGLRAEDAALIRCGVPEESCTVDIRSGGNWIQLSLTAYAPEHIGYPEGVDIRIARDNVGAFAEAIVANLNAVG